MKHISLIVAYGLAAGLAGAAAAPAHATSWSFKLLYTFCTAQGCVDGARPQGGVVLDTSGNVYGTTNEGGASGVGTVFEITTGGKEIIRHAFSFASTDGAYPAAGLFIDSAGDLYGTTVEGGADSAGTVFEVPHKGSEKLIDSLQFSERPEAGVIMDSKGNFYGTTSEGGANGGGAVFKLSKSGGEQTLYSFCARSDCTDGKTPLAGLVADKSGNLYGTVSAGGAAGQGLVFEVTPGGNEKVLCDFLGSAKCTSGADPVADLIRDKQGNLYGTTMGGGSQNRGTVFKLSSKGKETVLYNFCSVSNCPDGYQPEAGLVMDKAGNLYGTTTLGGREESGTIFEVAKNRRETVIYNFCEAAQCIDGGEPVAGLTMDASGNLYGTTDTGGAHGEGTAFELVREK